MKRDRSKIGGKLERLHASRVRHTQVAKEGAGEDRVYLASDVVEERQGFPTPRAEVSSPKTREATASSAHTESQLAASTQIVEGASRHGRKRVEAFLTWRDPGAVLGLGDAHPGQVLFLDIETSGLRNDDLVICVGAGWWDETQFLVRQWMLHDARQERALLVELAELAGAFEVLCSFNGKSFDVPRLRHACERHDLPTPFSGMRHADLIFTARRQLPRQNHALDLQTLERSILRFTRESDLPGSEVPRRWASFIAERDASLLDDILRHNFLDIVSLAGLLGHFACGAQLPLPIKGKKKKASSRVIPKMSEDRVGGGVASLEVKRAVRAHDRPLSPIQKKLSRTYELRGKSGASDGARGGHVARVESPGEGARSREPTHEVPRSVRERTTWLRESISEAQQRGASLDEVSPWIFELVALSPRHPFGLEQLMRYYEHVGATACAREVRDRLRRISPY